MVKLNWTSQAKNDLVSIAEYIKQDSEKFAKIQVYRIRDCVKILHSFPKTGRVVPEVDEDEIRELILGSYRIIYRIVSDSRIDILTIHHSARLLKI